MKPLEHLINVEKARLLHELFPQEIPALLEYVYNLCLTIQEDEQLTPNQWEKGLLTAEVRLSTVQEARDKIERYAERLHKQSRLFADQLFDGHVALYMVYCMTLYTTIRKHTNSKFVLAIDLLFNP